MNLLRIICFLSTLATSVLACFPAGASQQVRIGDDTYVCLTISPLNWPLEGSFVRMSSIVKADNFSTMNIQKSWTSMDYKNDTALKKFGISQRPGNGLGVAVESMGLISYQRAYRHVISNGTSVTYPLMMAVIHVTRGKVTSVSWDDEACVWCTSKPSQCGQNVYDYNGVLQTSEGKACWLPDEQCAVTSVPNSNSTTTALCELSVFITWTGTDSHGLYFKSAASRFSRMSSIQLAEFTTSRQAKKANDNMLRATVPTIAPTIAPSTI